MKDHGITRRALVAAALFTTIGRAIDTPANDWQEVIGALVTAGAKTNPAPGEVPSASWPYFGIAIMVSGGAPRGRIWLPTAVSHTDAEGNVWYTHAI